MAGPVPDKSSGAETPRPKPSSPIAAANAKTNRDFARDYMSASARELTWRHPQTKAEHALVLLQPRDMTARDLGRCFDLIDRTSGDDYRTSSVGWHPAAKRREMRSPDLRYLLVRDARREGAIGGFASLMPTHEGGEPVVYCYEIHLESELQGTGLGKRLMGFVTETAERIPSVRKVMLTCFVRNVRARAFYERLGFRTDPMSPRERRLRGGKTVVPDYVIMSRTTAASWARGLATSRDHAEHDGDGDGSCHGGNG